MGISSRVTFRLKLTTEEYEYLRELAEGAGQTLAQFAKSKLYEGTEMGQQNGIRTGRAPLVDAERDFFTPPDKSPRTSPTGNSQDRSCGLAGSR